MSDDLKLKPDASGATDKSTTTGADGKAASGVLETKTTLALGGGDPAADPPAPPAASWRDRLSGDDKDFRQRLDRFADETAFARSYRSLEQKLSSGEFKQQVPFPDKGTDEEKATWRKDQGIPDKHDAYDTSLGNGVVWGDADKPWLDDFLTHAHGRNYTPAQVKSNLEWYHATQEKMRAAQDDADNSFHRESEDTLRADWGPDYRPNLNAVQNLLATAPKGIRERIFGGRTADGRQIANDPETLKWFAQLSRDINPAASVLPATGADAKGVDARLAELQTMQRDRGSAYWRGDQSEKMQSEYRTLIEARDRNKGRAA